MSAISDNRLEKAKLLLREIRGDRQNAESLCPDADLWENGDSTALDLHAKYGRRYEQLLENSMQDHARLSAIVSSLPMVENSSSSQAGLLKITELASYALGSGLCGALAMQTFLTTDKTSTSVLIKTGTEKGLKGENHGFLLLHVDAVEEFNRIAEQASDVSSLITNLKEGILFDPFLNEVIPVHQFVGSRLQNYLKERKFTELHEVLMSSPNATEILAEWQPTLSKIIEKATAILKSKDRKPGNSELLVEKALTLIRREKCMKAHALFIKVVTPPKEILLKASQSKGITWAEGSKTEIEQIVSQFQGKEGLQFTTPARIKDKDSWLTFFSVSEEQVSRREESKTS